MASDFSGPLDRFESRDCLDLILDGPGEVLDRPKRLAPHSQLESERARLAQLLRQVEEQLKNQLPSQNLQNPNTEAKSD